MNNATTIAPVQTVLLIGSGRLAKHLNHWNSLLNQPHELLFWNRIMDTALLPVLMERADSVWLAISDRALIPFYESHLAAFTKPVIHFSGALNDDRLLSAHPLMSFPYELLDDAVYSHIHFAIYGRETLAEILPGFKNTFTVLKASEKSLYHALCVLAGNFPQILWNHTAAEMQKLGLPPEALDIYVAQIAANYLSLKDQSLTGPIVRGDRETIEKNIRSLSEHPQLQHIYETFNREFSA